MSKRVLMVDDEEDLVWTTAKQMKRERPDIQFEGVTDPGQALARVRGVGADLLITDIRMPGMSGLELMLAARSAAPRLPIVVITAYSSPEIRSEVQARGLVEFLEKPFTFPALLSAVDRLLTRGGGFSGDISLPMLPDLIQIYGLSRATGALRIDHAGGFGEIWLENGEVVHCASGSRAGEEAFYEILSWEGGHFSMRAGEPPPGRTIRMGFQELLMEGCRRIDEQGRDRLFPPASSESLGEPFPASNWELWKLIEPRLGREAVAIEIRGAVARDLRGGLDVERWPGVISSFLDAACRLAGDGPGIVEAVAADLAVAVSWDSESDTALFVADGLVGNLAAARFRSQISEAIRQAIPDFPGVLVKAR